MDVSSPPRPPNWNRPNAPRYPAEVLNRGQPRDEEFRASIAGRAVERYRGWSDPAVRSSLKELGADV